MAVFEEDKGTVTKEEIAEMSDVITEHQKDYNRRKQDKVKEILATREKLFARGERTYEIRVPVDEEEDGTQVMMKFKARRLTHEERSTMEAIKPYDMMSVYEISDDEFQKATEQGYEVLSKVIVEPKMSVDEWRKVDIAVTQDLIAKVSLLQFETNDTVLIKQLRNL
jgi:uncharacterized coiled-coil protein SlyX